MASLLRGLKGARERYRGVIAGGKCFQRGEKTVPTGGVHMAEKGEGVEGTGSGRGDAGPWLASGVGPKGFPGFVFIFFSSLLFFS
jgi:hypothetical protein